MLTLCSSLLLFFYQKQNVFFESFYGRTNDLINEIIEMSSGIISDLLLVFSSLFLIGSFGVFNCSRKRKNKRILSIADNCGSDGRKIRESLYLQCLRHMVMTRGEQMNGADRNTLFCIRISCFISEILSEAFKRPSGAFYAFRRDFILLRLKIR